MEQLRNSQADLYRFYRGFLRSLFVSLGDAKGTQPPRAEPTRLAVGYSGGINQGGRRSSYSTNIRVSVGAQALVSGAPFRIDSRTRNSLPRGVSQGIVATVGEAERRVLEANGLTRGKR